MNHKIRYPVKADEYSIEPLFYDELFGGCWGCGTIPPEQFEAAAREQMIEQLRLTAPPVSFVNINGLINRYGSVIGGQFNGLLEDMVASLKQEYWRMEGFGPDHDPEDGNPTIWPMDTDDPEPFEWEARYMPCDPSAKCATLVTVGTFEAEAFVGIDDILSDRWNMVRYLLADEVPDFKWGFNGDRCERWSGKLRTLADTIDTHVAKKKAAAKK